MAFIVETLTGDRRIKLGVESFARKMSFGNDWQKIGIHMLAGVNDSGADLTALRFIVGVSNGATIGFASNSLVDFVGGMYGALNYAAGNTSLRLPANAAYRLIQTIPLRKQGSTVTLGSGANNSFGYVPWTPVRYILRVDMVRTDMIGGYTFNAINIGAVGTPAGDFTPYDMRLLAENEAATGYVSIGGASPITAGNYYDSVMVSWDNATATAIEISNISVARYY